MKCGHVAMFEIGRWAKNELKQVHSAVDSCSSSYFPASSMIVFQTTASSHTHTSCKTNCNNTTAALHNIWCHDTRVEIGRWSKYQMKLDQTGLYLPSSSYFVKDIMHLTIYCWQSCTDMSITMSQMFSDLVYWVTWLWSLLSK